jgi:hypothetical protein
MHISHVAILSCAIALAGILLVALVFILRRLSTADISEQVRHYDAAEALLTPAERSFFGVLEQATGRGHRVFAKIRLADIVRPARGQSRSAWQSAFNRISCKHVDFVLCDPGDLKVRAVIELDDRSHGTRERGTRDDLVDQALTSAGIPIIHVPAKSGYSSAQLQKEISQALLAQTQAAG